MSKPANKLEKWYMDLIVSIGCMLKGCNRTDTSCHHINSGKDRMGHLFTLPLCWNWHHEGQEESIGNNKTEFVRLYGNEIYLMIELRGMLLERYPELKERLEQVFELQDDRIYRGKLKYMIIPPEGNEI